MEMDFAYRPGEQLPASAHRRLHAAGELVWNDGLQGWMVSSYDAVKTVLSDLARFTSEGTPVAISLGREAMLVDDTPRHHKVRAVWAKEVARSAMATRADELSDNAARLLAAVRPQLDAGGTVNFVPVFQDYVMAFIARSFAIPLDRLDVFRRWSQMSADTPAIELAEGSPAHARHQAVQAEVFALVRAEIEDRRARFERGEQPRDLVALMVAAEGSDGISPAMVVDNLFNFILGAMDTTEKWLGNILVRLLGDPVLLARLRADRSLLDPVIDEVMRLDTVAQVIMRRVRAGGADLAGQRLAAGDAIFVMLGAANRDPATFAEPDRFDPARAAKPHLGFGFGFHHCLGLNTARQEVLCFLTALLDHHSDLRVAEVDPGKSWALWGPRALWIARATEKVS